MTTTKQARLAHDELTIAFDRDSVRKFDDDGHLRIETANISKATVNPYLGREIPGWQNDGLDPNKVYHLLRDPAELARAADSFRGKPILLNHAPAMPHKHPHDKVVGAVGDSVTFEHPYLKSSLSVWTKDAIDGVESGEQRQLSSSYRYKPVWDGGMFEGQAYDGRMTDIVANHVAIVKKGRAGPDVLIGDSALELPTPPAESMSMSEVVLSRKATLVHGATLGYVQPLLASDALPDLSGVFAGITAANYATSKATIAGAIAEKLRGKLGEGKNLDALPKFLAAFDAVDPAEDKLPAKDAKEEEDDDKKKKAEDTKRAADAKKAEDARRATDAEKKALEDKEEDDKKKAEDAKRASDAISKAVSSAVEAAVTRERTASKALVEAKEIVEGSFGKMRAFDSAEDYYRAGLTAMEVKNVDKLDGAVLKPMVESLIEARGKVARRGVTPMRAADAAKDPRFPHADRLKRQA